MAYPSNLRFERLEQLLDRRGCKRSKHYADVADGLWTSPIHVGRAAAWPQHETDALLAALIAGYSNDEVRQLVRKLLEQRRAMMPQLGSAVP